MKLTLYGERIALTPVEQNYEGSLVFPQGVQVQELDLGNVIAIGDGKVAGKQKTITCAVGDNVMLQMNPTLAAQSVYKWKNQHKFMILHHRDLIARVRGSKVALEYIDMLGQWLLLEPFHTPTDSIIINPTKKLGDRCRVVKYGPLVNDTVSVKEGTEIIPMRDRCQIIQINGTPYLYTDAEWVHGVVED